ncbi:unnamed protein product [Ascophyllum nodosum]
MASGPRALYQTGVNCAALALLIQYYLSRLDLSLIVVNHKTSTIFNLPPPSLRKTKSVRHTGWIVIGMIRTCCMYRAGNRGNGKSKMGPLPISGRKPILWGLKLADFGQLNFQF